MNPVPMKMIDAPAFTAGCVGWRVKPLAWAATGSAISSASSSAAMNALVRARYVIGILPFVARSRPSLDRLHPLARILHHNAVAIALHLLAVGRWIDRRLGDALAQRGLQHLLHAIREDEDKLGAHLLGDIVDIRLVALRQDDRAN